MQTVIRRARSHSQLAGLGAGGLSAASASSASASAASTAGGSPLARGIAGPPLTLGSSASSAGLPRSPSMRPASGALHGGAAGEDDPMRAGHLARIRAGARSSVGGPGAGTGAGTGAGVASPGVARRRVTSGSSPPFGSEEEEGGWSPQGPHAMVRVARGRAHSWDPATGAGSSTGGGYVPGGPAGVGMVPARAPSPLALSLEQDRAGMRVGGSIGASSHGGMEGREPPPLAGGLLA